MAHVVTALHGFTGHPDDFEPLRERLPQHVWRGPVLYGHGPQAPRQPARDPWTATASGVLSDLVPGSIVVGYSMGGRIALEVARQDQRVSAVAALVLIGATPGIEEPGARAARRAQDFALAEHIESVPLGDFLDEWSQKPIIASQQAIPSPYRERMRARKTALVPWGLANSLRGVGTGSMPSLWGDLPRVPTLLLTGERDTKFAAIAERMVALMPNAAHVQLPGVGHCAHLEAPERAAQVIRRFLDTVPPIHD